MTKNETLLQLIERHVEEGNYEKAEAFAIVGEYLENCFHWELDFYPDQQEGDCV